MNIKITPNEIKATEEPREEFVQYICDAFLSPNVSFSPCDCSSMWSHYFDESKYIVIENGKGVAFSSKGDHSNLIYRCEVELAIKFLLENGYYLYRHTNRRGDCFWYCIKRYPNLESVCDKHVSKINPQHWATSFK